MTVRCVEALGEWLLLELQGSIDGPEDARGLSLARIVADKGAVEMWIGNHHLKGKIVDLKNPFAVLQKAMTPEGAPCMEVVAMIKRQVIFKTRPRPLVSSLEP